MLRELLVHLHVVQYVEAVISVFVCAGDPCALRDQGAAGQKGARRSAVPELDGAALFRLPA